MNKIKISKWSANNYFMTSLSNIALLKFVIVINGTYTVCENSISPVGVANDTYLAKHKQNSQYQNKWKLLYCVKERESRNARDSMDECLFLIFFQLSLFNLFSHVPFLLNFIWKQWRRHVFLSTIYHCQLQIVSFLSSIYQTLSIAFDWKYSRYIVS